MKQLGVSATLGYQVTARLGITASAGAILGGTVVHSAEGEVGRGVAGSLSLNYLALFESDSRPFLATSITLGAATSSPVSDDGQRHRWTAGDLRLGAMVGKTFFDRLVPFASARAFAGPVSWNLGGEDVLGSDIHKYTVGAGALFHIPGSWAFFAEALPLGEQSASLGGSLSF